MKNTLKVLGLALIAVIFLSAATCTGGSGVGKSLNSAEALKEYLDKQPANTPEKPIRVTMSANAPMLEKIVAAINSAGKYVSLNLSGNVLTTIPDEAFANCVLLTAINIPDSVDEIHGGMFNNTGLLNLPLPKSADTSGSGGGKIFYYSKAGFTMTDNNQVCHYLEAAPADMPGELAWASRSYTSTNITGTKDEIGAGRNNTAIILRTDAAAPAAKACKEYNYGSKTDWFLPSRYELNMLYMCKNYVGGFSNGRYWSSSQNDYFDNVACGQYFSDGYQYSLNDKYLTYSVRAVRAF
jgi:hypothetical protein